MSNSTSAAVNVGSSMFGYNASMPMAWIGGVVTSLLFLVHLFQVFHYRGYYLYLFILGIVLEVLGYWIRVLAIREPNNVGAVAMSYMFITIAPSFIAATCYMTYSRIIYWVCPEEKRTLRHTWVPVRWITTIFISLDLTGFAIACIGVFVYIANTSKSDMTPEQQRQVPYGFLKVAFFWQIALFVIFTMATLRFMYSSKTFKYDWPNGSKEWRKIAWTNFGTMAIISFRSLYRCLSFTVNGGDNYLRENEWPFYLFDFIPVVFILIIMALIHPANNIPREYTTIRRGYKKAGATLPSVKEIDEVDDEKSVSGYSRVTLAPPPINTGAANQTRAEGSSMAFNDPWTHQRSPGGEKL